MSRHIAGPLTSPTPLTPDELFLTLNGGLVVPAAAVKVALDLERRGFRLAVTDDARLLVTPDTALNDTDVAAIEHWRRHLVAVVCYEGPPQ